MDCGVREMGCDTGKMKCSAGRWNVAPVKPDAAPEDGMQHEKSQIQRRKTKCSPER